MDILTIKFEEPFYILTSDATIQMIAFKTNEHGNIKFGIEAPRRVKINREEIHQAILDRKEKVLTDVPT